MKHPNRLLAVVAALAALTAPLAACSKFDGTFTTACADIGNPPANAADDAAQQVIVLADVSDNGQKSAVKMADDIGSAVEGLLESADHIELTGLTSGGTDATLVKIDCMTGDQYYFSGGNQQRQKTERKELKGLLVDAMVEAIRATKVQETGDSRVLMRQVPTIASADSQVILWSDFLSQGTDCLKEEAGEAPSQELAVGIAQRCVDLDLLPSLPNSSVTVLGAGSSSDRPELASFGRALAAELCNRIAKSCEIR